MELCECGANVYGWWWVGVNAVADGSTSVRNLTCLRTNFIW